MHLLLTAFGSYGDVLPLVGIGAAMRRRGHRVEIIANPYFRGVVEGAGLELVPIGTAQEYLELTEHPDLWHPLRGLKLVFTRATVAYLRQTYSLVEEHYRDGETVIAAHGLDLASRVFQERHGAPMATVHLAPCALMTLHDTPRYIGALPMNGWPRWLKAAQFWAGDRFLVNPILGPPINEFRAELGLPPVKSIFSRWNHSPMRVLMMFPDWFGRPQPDWPPNTATVGFPLWDPPAAAELSAEVDRFLAGGEAPIVFAPGSANVQAAEFFQTAVEACERLGRRGVLMTKYTDQLPKSLPASVRHFGFVPFSKLLPRAAALVHHGGIGTTAQGLACGLPQLVMPMAYDQLDNGLRLSRLGVGAVVPRKKFKSPRVAAEFERLLTTRRVHERCHELARRCDGPASLERACDLLEELHATRGSDARRTAIASLG